MYRSCIFELHWNSGVSVLCEYQPIACGLHELYQYAVIKKRRLELMWVDATGKSFRFCGLPIDVFTRSKAEYLRFQIDGNDPIDIRLDRIQAAYWAQEGTPLTPD